MEYAEKNGMFFIETSAKTADNINNYLRRRRLRPPSSLSDVAASFSLPTSANVKQKKSRRKVTVKIEETLNRRFHIELDTYLEEGVYIGASGAYFDALEWWKEKNMKFKILSKMAADVLAIPITTVASESAFSAGGRVIEPHRSRLGTKMIDMLICGADWYRHYYGLHKKNKEFDDMIYIDLP